MLMDQFWRYETKREVFRIVAGAASEQGGLVNQECYISANFSSF